MMSKTNQTLPQSESAEKDYELVSNQNQMFDAKFNVKTTLNSSVAVGEEIKIIQDSEKIWEDLIQVHI